MDSTKLLCPLFSNYLVSVHSFIYFPWPRFFPPVLYFVYLYDCIIRELCTYYKPLNLWSLVLSVVLSNTVVLLHVNGSFMSVCTVLIMHMQALVYGLLVAVFIFSNFVCRFNPLFYSG